MMLWRRFEPMAIVPEAGMYEVVWPCGKRAAEEIACAERLKTLDGKTIGELSNQIFRSNEIFPIIERELVKRYAGIRFVTYDVFGTGHGKEAEVVAKLPGMLRESRCDAVISGVGC
jgi:hypothetical protein